MSKIHVVETKKSFRIDNLGSGAILAVRLGKPSQITFTITYHEDVESPWNRDYELNVPRAGFPTGNNAQGVSCKN